MDRRPGLSARLKLTLSYAGFLMLAGALLLAVVWVFLLRYVPDDAPDGLARDLAQPLRPAARLRPRRGRSAGLPARVRPPGGMDPRRPDARTTHTDHGCGTDGRERIAVPPDPHEGPPGRIP